MTSFRPVDRNAVKAMVGGDAGPPCADGTARCDASVEAEKRPGVVSPARDGVAAGQSQLAQATTVNRRVPNTHS